MKTNKVGWSCGGVARWVLLPIVGATLLACPQLVSAATQWTAQVVDIPLAVLDPGQWSFPGGNLHVRGMTVVSMHLSDEPLINGRMTWIGDFNGDADGNGIFKATWTHEVGTWAGVEEFLADPVKNPPPVFTPSPDGAVFVGILQFKGNLLTFTAETQSACVGHGMSGQAEGIQLKIEGGAAGGVGLYTVRILDPHAEK